MDASASPDQVAIRTGWEEFWRVHDKYTTDPNGYSEFTEVSHVTVDSAAADIILSDIQDLRKNGWVFRGGLMFHDVVVNEPVANEAGERTATITYCLDLEHTVMVTTEGELVEQEDQYFKETTTMLEGADGIWRVADIRNKEVYGC